MGDVINIDHERRKHRQLDLPRWTVMDLVQANQEGLALSRALTEVSLQQSVFTAP